MLRGMPRRAPMLKEYGDWIVDDPNEPDHPDDNPKNRRIACTCRLCGTRKRVFRNLLRHGMTSSHAQCPGRQWNYNLVARNDGAIFPGARFGRLTVTTGEIIPTRQGGHRKVEVVCHHGEGSREEPKVFTVAITDLLKEVGPTRSCRCYIRDNNRRRQDGPTDEELAAIEREN